MTGVIGVGIVTALRDWLESLGLGHCVELFEANSIDMDVVPELSEDDLRELGMSLGDRKRAMRGIAALGGGDVPAPEPAPKPDKPGEELRQLTLMFVDLVGSTRLSIELDLEEYRETLQAYQNVCLDVIRKHYGFVAQFLGDGIVAYFGYPIAEENDAERAVLAGLEIASRVRQTVTTSGQTLEVRVGIATGDVLIGDIVGGGSGNDHFALGDTPNLAARIQAAVEPGTVAISAGTYRLLGSNFDCVFGGEREFKGFADPVAIWTVRGVRTTESRFRARRHGALSPLVGRSEEIALLEKRWADASAGAGQAVLISGEAGIGKSRLAESLIAATDQTQATRLSFQCSPYHQDSTFYPVIAQLTHAIGLSGDEPGDVKLARIREFLSRTGPADPDAVAAYASLLSADLPEPGRNMSAEEVKQLIVSTLLGQVDAMAADKPLLVLFEDLHWIDPSSEDLLDLLIEGLEEKRILLICTHRPDYRARWSGKARVTSLSLSRLDGRHSGTLIRHLLADHDVSAELERMISQRAEGVPLFVEEMARMIIEQREVGNGTRTGDAEMVLPSTLKDLIQAKIDHLPDARDIVSVCAALGRSFTTAMVAAVQGAPVAVTRHLLDMLAEAQILVERAGMAEQTYTFRHALIQEAAYEAMLQTRARALHRQIAEVYVDRFPGLCETSPELLAQHLWRAGMAAEASDRWRAAAELAISRSATQEAIAHVEAAIRANDTPT